MAEKAAVQPVKAALNAAQRQVVEDLEHHILLVAPAGTGKTNTLAARIAAIIAAHRAKPEEILCLTFTNKACKEMRERIELRAGEAGQEVVVRTLHGFCYDIIKAEAKRHSDLFADFTICDEVDAQSVLRELCQQLLPDMTGALPALQALIAQLKTARGLQSLRQGSTVTYAQVLADLLQTQAGAVHAKCLDANWHFDQQLYAGWQDWGARLTEEYDRRLQELHGLDFTDLIVNAGLLLADDTVAGSWARRFLYINIDEVQDTSELEYLVISRLFGASRLLLAGDYFQTIYEWRGSHPEQVLQAFQRDYQPRRIVLHTNYRATQVLLAASFACLQAMFPERVATIYPEGMEAESDVPGAPILLKNAQDIYEEAWWIYQTILQLPVTDYRRVCILTRTNRYNRTLSDYFQHFNAGVPLAERLPFMLIDEKRFYRRQEIKDVLAFLKLALNKHDVTSLVRILKRFGQGIGPATMQRIASPAYRRAGLRLTDYLDPLARAAGDPFQPLTTALAQGNVVVFDVESTGVDPTHDEIIQIAGIRLDAAGQVAAEFKHLLHPQRCVGTSVRVHRLTDDYLAAHGEDPRAVLQAFCDFARGSVIVGHNVTYDLSILGSQLARLGLPQLTYVTYFDTLDIFRRYYPNLPNHKLAYLGQYCQVQHASSHDAMDDILATAELLQYALERNIRPTAAERQQYFAAHVAPVAAPAAPLAEPRQEIDTVPLWQLLADIVTKGGVADYYTARQDWQRMENLRNLFLQARAWRTEAATPRDAAVAFLRETSLSATDLEAQTKRASIPLITVHQAKGAEFDYVFLAGLQEYNFPSYSAVKSGQLDEEKRLFYVAITRARQQLLLSWCQQANGHYQQPSRFLDGLPAKFIQQV